MFLFVIKNDEETITAVDNTPKKVEILLQKRADDIRGAFLDGAVFDLYNSDYTSETAEPRKPSIEVNQQASLGDLSAGTYFLVETIAPDGYNLMTVPLRFTIEVAQDGTYTVKYQQGNAEEHPAEVKTDGDKMTSTVVAVNSAGVSLPHTGGIGTTVFTAGGISLIALALFLLMKKRMAMHD